MQFEIEARQFSKTIILGNGAFPKHPISIEILKNAETIICCDGAADELIARGMQPTLIIGDMDSISSVNRLKYKEIITQIPDQDTNDQTKAIEWAIKYGYSDIVILGATGKREDHTIGNISLLCNYANRIKVCSVSNNGIFTPVLKSSTFKSFAGQQVSIFSLNSETKITSENLKFPLNELNLKSWWMGALNESMGESFSLMFEKGEVIVFQVFES
jgi:thiamine pyrophosphokinase